MASTVPPGIRQLDAYRSLKSFGGPRRNRPSSWVRARCSPPRNAIEQRGRALRYSMRVGGRFTVDGYAARATALLLLADTVQPIHVAGCLPSSAARRRMSASAFTDAISFELSGDLGHARSIFTTVHLAEIWPVERQEALAVGASSRHVFNHDARRR
jgi:hypothetical protein